mmetsp:Transcript_19266/g.28507  ORF Transcript_19266/g.28507 Transcript_19266/m.28507 type:complete len:657 (+) Transcript_19266:101-2071(+)
MASQEDATTADRFNWNQDSTVVMVELITSRNTIDGTGSMDIENLLQLMDLATCASAEKHTSVNCVTASMGDVVFEYIPQCGDLLELTATPVFAGTTSLDIGLNVVAECGGGVRQFVCYASFTYVTMRDKDGKKQLCPPLRCSTAIKENDDNHTTSSIPESVHHIPESVQWERTLAYYRRALVKAEMKSSTLHKSEKGIIGSGFDFEFSEVVLPAHQNHMCHTFGGIIMSWMCKAALAEASRKSKCKCGSLRIRAVLRVDFVSGSDVSDHLVFRPRLNAIFDNGRSVEIEVRVSRRSIKNDVEIDMNTGYFYVSGVEFGPRTEHPFAHAHAVAYRSSATEDVRGSIESDARWRRRLLLARRHLLGGDGEPVEWHPALHHEAPLLTILAVLRLVHHNNKSIVEWKPLHEVNQNKKRGSVMSSLKMSASTPRATDVHIEYTMGKALGRKDTFILRGKCLIRNMSVKTLFGLIKNERPHWDELCRSIDSIEVKNSETTENDDGDGEIQWDVVQHVAITPTKMILLRRLCCLFGSSSGKACRLPTKFVPLCLLRSWRTEKKNGDTVLASRSVRHPDAAEGSLTEVLPSGWFLRPAALGDLYDDHESSGVFVTYVVEHDLRYLRLLAPFFSDEAIIHTIARATKNWFSTFASMSANNKCYEA